MSGCCIGCPIVVVSRCQAVILYVRLSGWMSDCHMGWLTVIWGVRLSDLMTGCHIGCQAAIQGVPFQMRTNRLIFKIKKKRGKSGIFYHYFKKPQKKLPNFSIFLEKKEEEKTY